MIRRLIQFLFVLLMQLSACSLSAQLHDHIWLFGYDSNSVDSAWGGSVMDFSGDSIVLGYEQRDMFLNVTNASICDAEGDLLFYTNGIYIADATNEVMENGSGLNPGEFADDHLGTGYILNQGAMAFQVPENDSLYYLLHTPREYPNSQLGHRTPLLYFTSININENNGLGAVIEKNQIILSDTIDSGKITAVKHANGVDWWVLLKEYDTNGYHRVLITADSIIHFGIQQIGSSFSHGLGQAVFSPDGSKYVLYNLVEINEGNYLNIYDFDRCTGLLNNHIQENMIDTAWAGGVAISPNSRFLYVSSFNYIYQYDLYAEDVIASKDTVAIYDGYVVEITETFHLATRFFLMQLGPDGKIYINCPAGVNVLHVIENPDEGGTACNVIQHGIQLPTYNAFSMPNFPNYRLGALDTPCDTTTSIDELWSEESHYLLYPNPAVSEVTLVFNKAISFPPQINIYNSVGELVEQIKLPFGRKEYSFNVGTLNNGIYICEVAGIGIEKLIIFRE